jgi:branched-chain amino acid transport system substrate-binding protein
MDKDTGSNGILNTPVSRRKVLAGAAAGGAALMLGSRRIFAAGSENVIRLGFISPRSGKLGFFGQSDPYILKLARKALSQGINVDGINYEVKIIDRDSQSSPSRASQLARDLITQDKIDLMLATSTPEVTNPVADACEAAGVPNLATEVPWQSFYFGRGAKPGQPSPFKWTFVFSFGTRQFANAYLSAWSQLKTNKKVGVMYPNDADGNAVREHLAPALEEGGYKIVDPGPYEDGTTDYSSQIALFNRENCEIFNTFPIPADFNRFWRQAAQHHYTDKVKIAQVNKSCQFPDQVKSLGHLGYNLLTTESWSPVFPYKSPLTGLSSQQLGDDFQKATGKLWNEQIGVSMSLLDLGFETLKACSKPTSRDAIRKAITMLNTTTMVGKVNFTNGDPNPNVSTTPQIGMQWIKAPSDSKFKLGLVTVDHADDPNVPIQQKLMPYNA